VSPYTVTIMYSVHMPTVIASMPHAAGHAGRPHDTSPKYDWSTIFDGRVHHFGPDEVPSTPRNFAKQVKAAAARRGVEVSVVTRARQGVYVEAQLAAGASS
jgi:hypothetical protein